MIPDEEVRVIALPVEYAYSLTPRGEAALNAGLLDEPDEPTGNEPTVPISRAVADEARQRRNQEIAGDRDLALRRRLRRGRGGPGFSSGESCLSPFPIPSPRKRDADATPYFAAAVLAVAAAAISHQGRGPAAQVAQIAFVFLIVISVFTAMLIFAFLGVITAVWVGQFYYGQF